MKDFPIDPQLTSVSSRVTELKLCQVRLYHNAAFPWLMLIPRQINAIEILDLSKDNQQLLTQEIVQASHVMQKLFKPDKLNVANLGNVVPQLHIHVVARYRDDKAWPGPVWNSDIYSKYSVKNLEEQIELIATTFEQLP